LRDTVYVYRVTNFEGPTTRTPKSARDFDITYLFIFSVLLGVQKLSISRA